MTSLQTKAVREALSIGIDRQKIIDNALNGIGKPAEGFTTNLEWGNPPSYEDGQTEKAAQIMEAAGWSKGKDGIYEKMERNANLQCWRRVEIPQDISWQQR